MTLWIASNCMRETKLECAKGAGLPLTQWAGVEGCDWPEVVPVGWARGQY